MSEHLLGLTDELQALRRAPRKRGPGESSPSTLARPPPVQAQVYALVRDRSLLAVKIGGRGQWRVERSQLEAYIARLYQEAEARDPADLPGAEPGENPDPQT